MEHKTKVTDRTTTERRVEEFNMMDAKGRWIGAFIVLRTVTHVALTEADMAGGCYSWYRRAPGTYQVANIHATRNGETYGALQNDLYFDTDADRVTGIAKRLDGMRKRYAKMAA